MFKKLLSNLLLILSLFIVTISYNINAQTTVYTQNFNAPGTTKIQLLQLLVQLEIRFGMSLEAVTTSVQKLTKGS